MRRWSNASIGSQYLVSATGLSTPLSNSDRGPSEAQAPPRSGMSPFSRAEEDRVGDEKQAGVRIGECDAVDNVEDALAIILGVGGKLRSLGQTGLAECRGHFRHPLVRVSVSEGEMKAIAQPIVNPSLRQQAVVINARPLVVPQPGAAALLLDPLPCGQDGGTIGFQPLGVARVAVMVGEDRKDRSGFVHPAHVTGESAHAGAHLAVGRDLLAQAANARLMLDKILQAGPNVLGIAQRIQGIRRGGKLPGPNRVGQHRAMLGRRPGRARILDQVRYRGQHHLLVHVVQPRFGRGQLHSPSQHAIPTGLGPAKRSLEAHRRQTRLLRLGIERRRAGHDEVDPPRLLRPQPQIETQGVGGAERPLRIAVANVEARLELRRRRRVGVIDEQQLAVDEDRAGRGLDLHAQCPVGLHLLLLPTRDRRRVGAIAQAVELAAVGNAGQDRQDACRRRISLVGHQNADDQVLFLRSCKHGVVGWQVAEGDLLDGEVADGPAARDDRLIALVQRFGGRGDPRQLRRRSQRKSDRIRRALVAQRQREIGVQEYDARMVFRLKRHSLGQRLAQPQNVLVGYFVMVPRHAFERKPAAKPLVGGNLSGRQFGLIAIGPTGSPCGSRHH